jgi:hypothetical protein
MTRKFDPPKNMGEMCEKHTRAEHKQCPLASLLGAWHDLLFRLNAQKTKSKS